MATLAWHGLPGSLLSNVRGCSESPTLGPSPLGTSTFRRWSLANAIVDPIIHGDVEVV